MKNPAPLLLECARPTELEHRLPDPIRVQTAPSTHTRSTQPSRFPGMIGSN